ncbi:MAG: metallophosphoesterase family protein [Deltaproteobacteria bacterium]|nr:metallophosphoesterase family protein [Deltaproteobacteria bacterium]
MITVGVISDTHGLLRPEAVEMLRGSDLILHAGDIGAPWIIDSLMTIAPVRAIRGNTDREPWAQRMPDSIEVEVEDTRILVVHDAQAVRGGWMGTRCASVVCGHSHQPLMEECDGVLFFNPGSAGPRRFSLPVSVGKLYVEGARVRGKILIVRP